MRRKDREVTDIEIVKEIVENAKVCHVAVKDGEVPYIVPLSYGYQFDREKIILYFHSAKVGKKIDLFHQENKVCFEISNWREPQYNGEECIIDYGYSSVIGYGSVIFIEEIQEKRSALSCINVHQTKRSVNVKDIQLRALCIYKIESDLFFAKST